MGCRWNTKIEAETEAAAVSPPLDFAGHATFRGHRGYLFVDMLHFVAGWFVDMLKPVLPCSTFGFGSDKYARAPHPIEVAMTTEPTVWSDAFPFTLPRSASTVVPSCAIPVPLL